MNKFIRSRLSILVAVCILVSLFGCSANENNTPESEETQPTESLAQITQITADGEIPRPTPETTVPETVLTLPEDAPYSVECQWYACAEGDDTALEPGQEFGPDIEYYIRLSFTLEEAAAQQHAFAENVKLKLNAEALNPTSYAPDRVEFEKAFYVGDAIWFVDISLDDPVEGSIPAPSYPGESRYTTFTDYNHNSFGTDKNYPLVMHFMSLSDSTGERPVFLEHTKVRINGILAEELEFYDIYTCVDYYAGRTDFYVGLDHAPGYTPNRVEYVSLDGYPELKIEVGSPAPGPIEDTMDYHFVHWEWAERVGNSYQIRDDIIFEDGKTYRLTAYLLANYAFYFPEDIKCFFADYPCDWSIEGESETLIMNVYISFGDGGLTPITSLDLILQEPKEGDLGTDIATPTVDSSFCAVEEWGIYEQTGQSLDRVTDAFDPSKAYAYSILLIPESGYYFPEDITITVNGEGVTLSYSFINGRLDIFYEPGITRR